MTVIKPIDVNGWQVDFVFCVEGYDEDTILSSLEKANAPSHVLEDAVDIMTGLQFKNTGFTYTNPKKRKAVVVIGPTSSSAEAIDTFVHEMYHLASAISSSLGLDVEGEFPAYLAGDSARELVDIVCRLSCSKCS